jgi:hypothetical protein
MGLPQPVLDFAAVHTPKLQAVLKAADVEHRLDRES